MRSERSDLCTCRGRIHDVGVLWPGGASARPLGKGEATASGSAGGRLGSPWPGCRGGVRRLTPGPAGTAGQVLGASDVGVARVCWQRLLPRASWALVHGDTDLPHRRSFRLVPGLEVRTSLSPLGGGVLATACRDVLNAGLPAVGNAGTISQRTAAGRAAAAVVFPGVRPGIWRMSGHRCCGAGCRWPRPARAGGYRRVGRPVRRYALAIGEQRAGVLEQHDAVAEQAPALSGMGRHDVGRLAIGCARGRAGGLVLAHDALR